VTVTPEVFAGQLQALKTSIDDALGVHVKALHHDAATNYTPYSAAVVDAYLDVLNRGGKRIRGALTIIGYQMCGGKDMDMIVQAAAAIEMVHAYILVLDDIMDRSEMRRGGASAHTAMANYHKSKGLSGNGAHFGESVAINGALIGNHFAQGIITGLMVNDAYKLTAIKLLNEALVVTGHGQINDIFNEALDTVNERDVDQVLEWKTAHYTFLNPLQFGMALSGADKATLNAIKDYCMYAGRAFQITDDVLGTFSSEQEAGKSPMDDIREGKRTVLTVAALERATNSDKNFLIQMLGNKDLTQAQFIRCKEILVATGALQVANSLADTMVAKALTSLHKNESFWPPSGSDFLAALVEHLLGRAS
jgi:geranylgeranyl diphosphate synthase type I